MPSERAYEIVFAHLGLSPTAGRKRELATALAVMVDAALEAGRQEARRAYEATAAERSAAQ